LASEPKFPSHRALCETVKDFATHILKASLNTGDQHLREKCEVLQQKLDLLLQTLSKEESYLSDNMEETDIATLKTETTEANNQEKETLEKSKKEMANVKRAGKKCYMEKDAVMSRYGVYIYNSVLK
jgi:diacylglycerol kinase (ATP)